MSRRGCWAQVVSANRCGSLWSCFGTAGSDERWAQSGPRESVRGRTRRHAGVPFTGPIACERKGRQEFDAARGRDGGLHVSFGARWVDQQHGGQWLVDRLSRQALRLARVLPAGPRYKSWRSTLANHRSLSAHA